MVPSKRIYFIRHGQSEGNAMHLLQDEYDPLTELGKEQAKLVAQRVQSINAEVILTSTMVRALDTARIIAETTGLQLEARDSLREYMVPSSLVNLPFGDALSMDFYNKLSANIHNPDWRYADEESFLDCHARAVLVIEELETRPEKNIIVVSHGAFMRYIFAAMMNGGQPEPVFTTRLFYFMKKENTGISTVQYFENPGFGNKWHLTAWNDCGHLSDEHKTYT